MVTNTNHFKCHACGETFGNQDELREHNRNKHSQYECEHCGQMFFSQEELNTHMHKMHPQHARRRAVNA